MVDHLNIIPKVPSPTAPIAATCTLKTMNSGTKKKVTLNTKVEYMNAVDGTDNDSISSPDLDKLDGDGDYVDPYGIDNSDSEEDDSAIHPITEPNPAETDPGDIKDEHHTVHDLQAGTNDDGKDRDDRFVGGPMQYRDPTDKRFLRGFELHHFDLGTDTGTDKVNLRMEEATSDDRDLHTNLAIGLVNALLNSSTKAAKQKGKQLKVELKNIMVDQTSKQKITKPKKHSKTSSSKKKREKKTKDKRSSSRNPKPAAIDVDR